MTVFIALLLAASGLLVLGYIVYLFFSAIAGEPRTFAGRLRFKGREQLARQADACIQRGEWETALKVIQDAFYFDRSVTDSQLVEKINNHHVGLLSRLLIISDKASCHMPNLEVLEGLLSSRAEMLRDWCDAQRSIEGLKRKRSGRVPEWAFEEYRKRLAELEDRLATNQKSLRSLLDATSRLLEKGSAKDQPMTVH